MKGKITKVEHYLASGIVPPCDCNKQWVCSEIWWRVEKTSGSSGEGSGSAQPCDTLFGIESWIGQRGISDTESSGCKTHIQKDQIFPFCLKAKKYTSEELLLDKGVTSFCDSSLLHWCICWSWCWFCKKTTHLPWTSSVTCKISRRRWRSAKLTLNKLRFFNWIDKKRQEGKFSYRCRVSLLI